MRAAKQASEVNPLYYLIYAVCWYYPHFFFFLNKERRTWEDNELGLEMEVAKLEVARSLSSESMFCYMVCIGLTAAYFP